MSAAEELRVAWSPPGGQTPPQCLEYEVQLAEAEGEAEAAWAVGTTGPLPQGGEGGEPTAAAGRHTGKPGFARRVSCPVCRHGTHSHLTPRAPAAASAFAPTDPGASPQASGSAGRLPGTPESCHRTNVKVAVVRVPEHGGTTCSSETRILTSPKKRPGTQHVF